MSESAQALVDRAADDLDALQLSYRTEIERIHETLRAAVERDRRVRPMAEVVWNSYSMAASIEDDNIVWGN